MGSERTGMANMASNTKFDASNVGKVVATLSMGKAREIPIGDLNDYPHHVYTTYDKEKLTSLAESIKQNGLAQPILVWFKKDEDKFFILCGHNRKNACKLLGMEKVSCIVKEDLTDAEANLLVHTNLDQRGLGDFSLYDKCKSIIEVLKDLKELSKQDKLKSYSELLKEGSENDNASQFFGVKVSQIYNYKKLGENLSKDWFDLYGKNWDFKTGLVLSNLNKDTLKMLYGLIKKNPEGKIKLNEKMCKDILKWEKQGMGVADIEKNFVELKDEKTSKKEESDNSNFISQHTKEDKNNEDNKLVVDFSSKEFADISRVFEGMDKKQIIDLLHTLLVDYDQ